MSRVTAVSLPRRIRVFVAVLLAALVVPGVIGFDAWPLTGWRLFSADRGNTQTRWEIAVVEADGTSAFLDLDVLPIAYRNAEWILAELPDADEARREEVCRALLAGVREHARPDASGLELVRNRRVMQAVDGGFEPVEAREPYHRCGAP